MPRHWRLEELQDVKYVRYQGLRKISYVENKMIKSQICSIAPQNSQILK